MSYKNKLQAWGLDRAIAAKSAGFLPEATTFEDLLVEAQRFAEFAYSPEENLNDLIGQIGELLMKCENPLVLAEQIQNELDVFKEQMPLHLAKSEPKAAVN